jgi:hypothetical protein
MDALAEAVQHPDFTAGKLGRPLHCPDFATHVGSMDGNRNALDDPVGDLRPEVGSGEAQQRREKPNVNQRLHLA